MEDRRTQTEPVEYFMNSEKIYFKVGGKVCLPWSTIEHVRLPLTEFVQRLSAVSHPSAGIESSGIWTPDVSHSCHLPITPPFQGQISLVQTKVGGGT